MILSSLKTYYNRIYESFKKYYWGPSIWYKIILSSLVGAVGGGSFISLLNYYALYYHAVCQKIRVPAEGVEYIKLSISLLSFGVIITSITSTILIYLFFKSIAYLIKKIIKSQKENSLAIQLFLVLLLFAGFIFYSSFNYEQINRKKNQEINSLNDSLEKIKSIHYKKINESLKNKNLNSESILAIKDSTILVYDSTFQKNSIIDTLQLKLTNNKDFKRILLKKEIVKITSFEEISKINLKIVLLILFLPTYFLIYYIVQNEKRIILFTLLITFIFTTTISASLFNQPIYKSFLSKIRYGGEIPIEIEYLKANDEEDVITGLLLIRSEKYLTLKNILTKENEEIPINRISKITTKE